MSWIAQVTVLRTHNAEDAGSIPSLARTFNSFEKPFMLWKSLRVFPWNLAVRFLMKPNYEVFQRPKMGSLYGTSWKPCLRSPKSLSLVECMPIKNYWTYVSNARLLYNITNKNNKPLLCTSILLLSALELHVLYYTNTYI